MIKFNKSKIDLTALEYAHEILGIYGIDRNKYGTLAHDHILNFVNTNEVLLTHSCTAALEMAAMLIDIKPGDEVIMPSYTFVSTANAFVLRGAVPVFVDISPDTLNIDSSLIESAITPKTKAIVPVHYAAVACDMVAIMDIAEKNGLFVIEDAAQCINSFDENGRHLGTIGHFGVFSFHNTKNITSGLGGALLINDESFVDRAKVIWQKGTNREAFLLGQVDKYSWVDIGSSYMLPELSAALLYSQLQQVQVITTERMKIWKKYYSALEPLSDQGLISLPNKLLKHNAHIFYMLCRDKGERDKLLAYGQERGVQFTFHYIPLHSSIAGSKFGRAIGDMYTTNNVSDRLIRLPLHLHMDDNEVVKVVDVIKSFYEL